MHVVCVDDVCKQKIMVLNVKSNGIWLKTLINRDENKSVCFTTSLDNLAYSHKMIATITNVAILMRKIQS